MPRPGITIDTMGEQSNQELSAFAAATRAWLAKNFPPSLAFKNPVPFQNDAPYAESHPDFLLWRARMADKGWGAPDWAPEYGGAGLDAAQMGILAEEMARIGAFNPMRNAGYTMLGPTLLEYGTDAQKARHLPPIARGETRWCQGFSEPGAGSDLAALQTRCLDDGDHWVVTGQKIWTSSANHADWCFALVRTDMSRKHAGIGFLLIDMRSPGVSTRPLILISGANHFCELFFDDVRVPKGNMVGQPDQGWAIAKHLLQHERDSLSEGRGGGPDLVAIARQYVGVDGDGHIADADLRARMIANAMRAQAFNLAVVMAAEETKAGHPANLVPALKNIGADVAQTRAELMIEIMGNQGLGWTGDAFSQIERDATRQWLHSRAFSIYGGSQEIQNNIIAKRVLGLPDAPGSR